MEIEGHFLQDNKAIMRYFIEQVQEGRRVDLIDRFVAEGYVNHTPPPGATSDREGMKGIFEALHGAFPDLEVEIVRQVSDEDTVATYKIFRGTHAGDWRGIAATGLRVEIPLIDMVRFRDGLMTEHWAVLNEAAPMRQLGVIR